MRAIAEHVRARSVSYIALFFALTGSAFAAVSVQGRDVADATLSGADVRPGSLMRNVLEPGVITARAKRGPRGPRGSRGPRGYTGGPGPAGAPWTGAIQVVTGSKTNSADKNDTKPDNAAADVRCPAGMQIINGGGKITAVDGATGQTYEAPPVHFRESYMLNSDATGAQGWRTIGVEETGGLDDAWTVTTWAYCLRIN